MLTDFDRIRVAGLTRWHGLAHNLSREQTIAEHCHRMGIIADILVPLLAGDRYADDHGALYHLHRAIATHDDAELFTSDISSTAKQQFKRLIPNFAEILEQVEHQVDPKHRSHVDYLQTHAPLLLDVMTLSDILEASLFYSQYHLQDKAINNAVINGLSESLTSLTDKIHHTYPHIDTHWLHDFVHELMSQPTCAGTSIEELLSTFTVYDNSNRLCG